MDCIGFIFYQTVLCVAYFCYNAYKHLRGIYYERTIQTKME